MSKERFPTYISGGLHFKLGDHVPAMIHKSGIGVQGPNDGCGRSAAGIQSFHVPASEAGQSVEKQEECAPINVPDALIKLLAVLCIWRTRFPLLSAISPRLDHLPSSMHKATLQSSKSAIVA